MIRPLILLLPLLSFAACSGVPTPITRALDQALERRSWQDLRLDAQCLEDGQFLSTRLLGTGVGIWNHERQFAVPRERLLDLLAALHSSGFGAMRDSHHEEEEREERKREERARREHGGREGAVEREQGGWEEEEEEEKEEEEWVAPCHLRVRLDGVEQRSEELSMERQLAEVMDLARQVLATGSELGPSGQTAASLEDGLGKIVRGELAPETLSLQFQRQPDTPDLREGTWLLRVEDSRAEISFFAPETGWTEPQRVSLSREDVAGLARRIAIARPTDLPVNLHSSWYEDLQIQVLNRKAIFQARGFASLSPETHGARQKRFEEIVAALEELKRTRF